MNAATAGTPAITVDALRRSYGGRRGFEAVRGIDFRVDHGEVLAVLGTNGAGKTSAMEVVEGVAAPTSGRVRVLGYDPWADRAAARPRMGIMLQSGGFPSDLTVVETARMWAGTLSEPRPVAEGLEMVNLQQRAGTPVKQLSGGERRRLDLALSLLGNPEVLLLDEPTTGLDPESRRNTWRLISRLRAAGTAIVLTMHYLHEAEELADRIAILHCGAIVRSGSVAEIVAEHPSRITFATPPVAIPELAGSTVHTSATTTTVHTADLQGTLTELLSWAAERGIRLESLRASTASLESAFLAVAGEEHAASAHDTTHERSLS
ncbi:ABC-2 type transport system ATP-binding protein [Haloechinothrix alba]|uniref:ABC-2 type transport system ATP-binding protein n=1 Tax=Haloechinothrix alba TaxID=664784 RepID=A0A238VEP5_9PSEU|nr:ABC transporter ATP-binding protein [Haloechinothrix alba]SNR32638.1 ABC-2 type transport system ATP-binding protein [Haloechinothrix alba]